MHLRARHSAWADSAGRRQGERRLMRQQVVLVEAFAAVAARHPDRKLRICGGDGAGGRAGPCADCPTERSPRPHFSRPLAFAHSYAPGCNTLGCAMLPGLTGLLLGAALIDAGTGLITPLGFAALANAPAGKSATTSTKPSSPSAAASSAGAA